jgi:hypothetical protein
MNPYAVLLEMAVNQRRTVREEMAEALRNRHLKKYAVLEKDHTKLSDKITDYQSKLKAA